MLRTPEPRASDTEPVSGAVPDPGHAERVLHALADDLTASTAAALLPGMGRADGDAESLNPGRDARPTAEVIRLGWEAGGRAFDAGLSVQHVVRDADLLLAIVLAGLERDAEPLPEDVTGNTADAFGVARRLQRAMGRYTQAAASGFVHALLRNTRERYRMLRHDLRNPLGTIRSALSLMEDESVPEEMRHGPDIRSMVARNAGSLDQLIATELDDAAAAALLIPPQDIALRDVAIAARRDVREAARLAHCEVVIGDVPDAPPTYVEPAALELTLTALLLAGLSQAQAGDTVQIDCINRGTATPGDASRSADGRPCTVMRVSLIAAPDQPPRGTDPRWSPEGLALAAALAADHGGALSSDATGAEPTPAELMPDEPAAAASAEAAPELASAPALYLRLPITDEAAALARSADPAGTEPVLSSAAG